MVSPTPAPPRTPTLSLSRNKGFATAGDPRNASSLSDEMRSSGIEMDVVSYGTAISACAKAGDVQGALKLIKVCGSHPPRAPL